MNVTRTRSHVINMGNYESFRTEATVTMEVERPSQVDQEFHDLMDAVLTRALNADLEEASKLTTYAESYAIVWKKN